MRHCRILKTSANLRHKNLRARCSQAHVGSGAPEHGGGNRCRSWQSIVAPWNRRYSQVTVERIGTGKARWNPNDLLPSRRTGGNLPGISILPAGSGPSYTNTPLRTPDFFSARYSAPNSRQVGPRSTGNRLEPLLSGYFSGTAPRVCPVFAASLHSGRASASRHWQRPDPPQHVAEQSPGQMPFRQQEPVVPRMLHQPAPGFH